MPDRCGCTGGQLRLVLRHPAGADGSRDGALVRRKSKWRRMSSSVLSGGARRLGSRFGALAIAAYRKTFWCDQDVRGLKQPDEEIDFFTCRQRHFVSKSDAAGTFEGPGCREQTTHIVVGQIVRRRRHCDDARRAGRGEPQMSTQHDHGGGRSGVGQQERHLPLQLVASQRSLLSRNATSCDLDSSGRLPPGRHRACFGGQAGLGCARVEGSRASEAPSDHWHRRPRSGAMFHRIGQAPTAPLPTSEPPGCGWGG